MDTPERLSDYRTSCHTDAERGGLGPVVFGDDASSITDLTRGY